MSSALELLTRILGKKGKKGKRRDKTGKKGGKTEKRGKRQKNRGIVGRIRDWDKEFRMIKVVVFGKYKKNCA